MRRKTNDSRIITLFLIALLCFSALPSTKHKPVLYIIGDSTVRNGDGTGRNGQVGWGTVMDTYFDTSRISVRNLAIGGRSSRTFITDGRWDQILVTLTKGDFVLIQFGHNDAGPLNDTARARGTLRGTGEDSVSIYNPIRKMQETVHSYGWYLRKYVMEAKAKGAIPIICSPVPRATWKEGRIVRSEYTDWAREVAERNGAFFIDLQERIALRYEALDSTRVKRFFPADHTHTNQEGAELNAAEVVKGLQSIRACRLRKYLRP